jgi:hypothetical protein
LPVASQRSVNGNNCSVYVTVDLDDGDVMRQRLLSRACGLSCAAFGSGIDKRLDKQILIR